MTGAVWDSSWAAFFLPRALPFGSFLFEIYSMASTLTSRSFHGSMGKARESHNPVRRRWLGHHAIDSLKVRTTDQQHTKDILVVEDGQWGLRTEEGLGPLVSIQTQGIPWTRIVADGIITTTADPIAVTTADCMAIAIEAPGYRALLHSGWRGTGILGNALEFLIEDRSVSPKDISLWFGPHIRSCCFEIQEDAAVYLRRFEESAVITQSGGRLSGDIDQANRNIAQWFEIPSTAITEDGRCSCCDRSLQSYRRDGANFGLGLSVLL